MKPINEHLLVEVAIDALLEEMVLVLLVEDETIIYNKTLLNIYKQFTSYLNNP